MSARGRARAMLPKLGLLLTLLTLLALVACAHGNTSDSAAPRADAGSDAQASFDVGSESSCSGESCKSPCLLAEDSHSSVGCEYWAVDMDAPFSADNGCFVAFVANTYDKPAHLSVSFFGDDIDIASHVKIPRGSGQSLTYEDFDGSSGLPPGEVAIVFLAGVPDGAVHVPGDNKPVPCPVAPARTSLTQLHGTGRTHAFHLRTDVPVVAYQMLPYGGGNAAVTGASLLIPTSAWDTNYVAATAFETSGETSFDIVAFEDDTTVTILPKSVIRPGGGLPGGKAGEPMDVKLDQGEVLQITQPQPLSGSPVQADKPIGFFAGEPCMTVPSGVPFCDHGEQQIPPIRALGSEYVGASYRPRADHAEDPPWRIIGAVDGTTLTYDPPLAGAPTTLNLGDVALFNSKGRAFVVRSQDAEHPFLFSSYMTGATTVNTATEQGYGDPDFVRVVPAAQYLDHYVFFTDPTYPETNLVVTRKRGASGFPEVKLDCAGTLTGWTKVDAAGNYEMTRIDLVRHDFVGQNGCDNGRHEMTSTARFGLTVWGWGTAETKTFTGFVSYGYPAGENLAPLNTVVVPARPR